jgi:hypothetical protein
VNNQPPPESPQAVAVEPIIEFLAALHNIRSEHQ